MIRFSFYGHFAVAGVVATGVVNVALTSGLPLPPDTPYRALLDVKIGVVAVMIALALVNRYALVPRLAVMPRALATLRAFTIVNAGLGTLAIAPGQRIWAPEPGVRPSSFGAPRNPVAST